MAASKWYSNFAFVETILVLCIIGMISGTGYFVWHAKQSADLSLTNAANSKQGIVTTPKTTDFASCKAATGSKLLETYPEQCVSKTGDTFTDTSQSRGEAQSVRMAKFSVLPEDLRTVILAHATCSDKKGHLLDEGGSIFDAPDHYVPNKAAFVSECQTVALYAYTNGQWKFVQQTQFGFDCANLKQYGVSLDLLKSSSEAKCLDAAGNFIVYQE